MIALSSRNIEVNIAAMSSGMGMGFIADHEAEARGGFYPVLPANKDWTAALWLVTHVDLHRTEKVQAMLECIRSERQGQ